MQVDRSGFYPKGGGRCVLTARSLAPGACLPPLDLTERGRLVSIAITAFAAGKLGVGVAERMARAAERALHEVGFPCGASRRPGCRQREAGPRSAASRPPRLRLIQQGIACVPAVEGRDNSGALHGMQPP